MGGNMDSFGPGGAAIGAGAGLDGCGILSRVNTFTNMDTGLTRRTTTRLLQHGYLTVTSGNGDTTPICGGPAWDIGGQDLGSGVMIGMAGTGPAELGYSRVVTGSIIHQLT